MVTTGGGHFTRYHTPANSTPHRGKNRVSAKRGFGVGLPYVDFQNRRSTSVALDLVLGSKGFFLASAEAELRLEFLDLFADAAFVGADFVQQEHGEAEGGFMSASATWPGVCGPRRIPASR